MPLDNQIQKILEVLAKYEQLVDVNVELPRDYLTLKAYFFAVELRNTIHQIKQLLTHPQNFCEPFKTAWDQRVARNQNTFLDFNITPSNPTNRLYWDIARIISANIKDMIALFLPTVSFVITIDFELLPATTIKAIKKSMSDPVIKLIKYSLDACQEPPSESLEHLVVANQMVFDASTIGLFTYPRQEKVYQAMQSRYPALAKTLYGHNQALNKLKTNMELLKSTGRTPRVAIQNLIQGLLNGAAKDDATTPAQIAYLEFFSYWNGLPENLRKALNALGRGVQTFFDVLEQVKAGECVETCASYLSEILKKNENDPLLDTVLLDENQIVSIKNAYKNGINTRKEDTDSQIKLPHSFLPEALHFLSSKIEGIKLVLPHFHPEMVVHLVKHLYKIPDFFSQLSTLVNENLNAEQCASLGQALAQIPDLFKDTTVWEFVKYSHSSALKRSFTRGLSQLAHLRLSIFDGLNNAKMTNYLSLLPAQTLYEIFKDKDQTGLTLLHKIQDPEAMNAILLSLSEEERDEISALKDKKGETLIRLAFHQPKLLKTILVSLSKGKRLAIVKTHLFPLPTAKILEAMLSSLSKEECFELINEKTMDKETLDEETLEKETIFHKAYNNPALIKVMLNNIPSERHFDAIKKNGRTLLHSTAAEHPASFEAIVESLGSQCLQIILRKDKEGKTPLDVAIHSPRLLRTILLSLKTQEEMEVFVSILLNKVASNLNLLRRSLKVILEVLTEEDDNKAIPSLYNNSKLLHCILSNIPEAQRIPMTKYKDKQGISLFHRVCNDFESMQAIFSNLTVKQRIELTKIRMSRNGGTLLYMVRNNPEIIKFTLTSLPKKQRYDAFVVKNRYGHSPLHYLSKKPSSNNAYLESIDAPDIELDDENENKHKACLQY